MKRLILIISILTFSYGLLLSQDILWEKYYQPNKQIGTTSCYIKTTMDNDLILIAQQINKPMYYPYPIIYKIDKEGNQIWSKFIYTDNYFLDELSLDVTQNNDNSLTIISGINSNPVVESGWYWFFRFDVSEDGDSLNMVKRNKDDSPYTKGGFNFYRFDDSTFLYSLHSQLGNFFEGIFFVKLDSVGTIIWKKKLLDDDLILKPITKPQRDWDNNLIFLSNYVEDGDTYATLVLIKTDIDCNELSRHYIKSDFSFAIKQILPTSDSSYIISSKTEGITKIDKEMNTLWYKDFSIEGSVVKIYSMVENKDGDYIIAGSRVELDKFGRQDSTTSKLMLVKIDKNGNKSWELIIPKIGVSEYRQDIALSKDNDIYLSTTTQGRATIYKIRDNTVGVNDQNQSEGISIYPNPAGDFINISIDNDVDLLTREVQILDLLGLVVSKSELSDGNNRIDISDLARGTYFIKVGDRVEKFVKM